MDEAVLCKKVVSIGEKLNYLGVGFPWMIHVQSYLCTLLFTNQLLACLFKGQVILIVIKRCLE